MSSIFYRTIFTIGLFMSCILNNAWSQECPNAIAGEGKRTCLRTNTDGRLELNGKVLPASDGGRWVGGEGSFRSAPLFLPLSDRSNLNAFYFPSRDELIAGKVTLFLVANLPARSLCAESRDSITLYFDTVNVLNAGPDTIISCSDVPIKLFGTSKSSNATPTWSSLDLRKGLSTSVGFISERNLTNTPTKYSNSLNSKYILNDAEKIAGGLYLALNDTNSCGSSEDTVRILLNKANAINDFTTCSLTYPLSGTTIGSDAIWIPENGAGTITNSVPTKKNNYSFQSTAIFIPKPGVKGNVEVFLSSSKVLQDCIAGSDTVIIKVSDPSVVAKLGKDTVICNNKITLNATISGGEPTWSILNGGTFELSQLTTTQRNFLFTTTPGTAKVLLSVKSADGCEEKDTITITSVTPAPVIKLEDDKLVCTPSVKITGTSKSQFVTWGKKGAGVITDPFIEPNGSIFNVSATYTPVAGFVGNDVVYLSLTNPTANCNDRTDSINLNFNPSGAIAKLGNDTVVCEKKSFEIIAKASEGLYEWTITNGTLVPNGSKAVFTPGTVGTVSTINFIVKPTNNCPPEDDDLNITYSSLLTTVNVGEDKILCSSENEIPLQGSYTTSVSNPTFRWRTNNGAGKFRDNPTALGASTSTELAPTYIAAPGDKSKVINLIFETTTDCIDRDTVKVSFENKIEVEAFMAPITKCDEVQLTATASSGGVIWKGGSEIFTPNKTSLAVTYKTGTTAPPANGVDLILISSITNACGNDTATINNVVLSNKPIINAGTDQFICKAANTIILSGTVTPVSPIEWKTNGSGRFSKAGEQNTSYTIDPTDKLKVLEFYLKTVDTGICSNADTVKINFTESPKVSVEAVPTQCSSIISFPIKGSVVPQGTKIAWTTLGSGKFSGSTTSSDPVTNYTPSDLDKSQGVKLAISTTDPNCLDQDTINIAFINTPIVNAGPKDTALCSSVPSIKLNGSVPGGSTINIIWSALPGATGTFGGTEKMLDAIFTPSDADKINGVKLVLSSIGNCITKDTISIKFLKPQNIGAGPDHIICPGSASTVLLNGTLVPGGVGVRWTNGAGLSDRFTPNSNSVNNITYTPTDAEIANGQALIIFSTEIENGCNSRDTAKILFKSPEIYAGDDQTICNRVANIVGKINISDSANVKWSSTILSGSLGFSNASGRLHTTFTPPSDFFGIAKIIMTYSPGGKCTPKPDTMLINFIKPAIILAGADKNICGTSVVLSGNNGGANATWSANINGDFSPNTSIANAKFTPTTTPNEPVRLVYATKATFGCPSVKDEVIVNFTNNIEVTATGPSIVCSDIPSVEVKGTSSSGSGIWGVNNGDGKFVSETNFNTSYTLGPMDKVGRTIQLTFTSTNNDLCAATSKSFSLTITTQPINDAGPDGIACGNSVTLKGVSTPGSSVSWKTSYPGKWENDNTSIANPTFTYSGDRPTVPVEFIMTRFGANGCQGNPADAVSITFLPPPTISAGGNKTVCSATATLTGTVSDNYDAEWTSSFGSFNPNNTKRTVFTPTNPSTSPVSVTYSTISNGYCKSFASTALVIFSPGTTVDAGTTISACKQSIGVPLNGKVTGATTTGKWKSPTGGSFVPNDSTLKATYKPTNADITNGSVTLNLESTNNSGCEPLVGQVKINLTDGPTIFAGNDNTVCSNNANYKLAGTISAGTVEWKSQTNGKFLPDNTSLDATYEPSLADINSKAVFLELTSTGNANCVVSDTMKLSISPAPRVDAGDDIFVCKNSPTANLNGTIESADNKCGWIARGTGKFLTDSNKAVSQYQPSAADIAKGSIKLILSSALVGNCKIVKDSLILTFTDSSVQLDSVQSICINAGKIPLKGRIIGTSPKAQWTSSGTGTYIPDNTTLITTYIPSSADLKLSSLNFTLSGTSNSTCTASNSATTKVTFTPAPDVKAGPDITFCSDTVAKLSGNVIIAGGLSGSGRWRSLGTGNVVPPDSLLTTSYRPSALDISTGGAMLILQSTNNGTCNPKSDTLNLIIEKSPIVNAGVDQKICSGTSIILNGDITGVTKQGSWFTSSDGAFLPEITNLKANYIKSAKDSIRGFVLLKLKSTQNKSCREVTDSMKITFLQPPIISAGKDIIACKNATLLQLNGSINSFVKLKWSSSGTGFFDNSDTIISPKYLPSKADLDLGTISLVVTGTQTITCSTIVKDTVLISFSDAPIAIAGKYDPICANNSNTDLLGKVTLAGGGRWVSSGNGIFVPNDSTLKATYKPSKNDIAKGLVKITLTTIKNGSCTSAKDSTIITYSPAPIVQAGRDINSCSNSNVNLVGIVTGPTLKGKWTTFGDGLFSDSLILSTTYIPGTKDLNDGFADIILTSTNNLNCNPVKDTITIKFTSQGIVNAGEDQTVCANDKSLNLVGKISGGPTKGKWISSGNGSFIPSDSALKATYILGTTDITQPFIELSLTTTNGCAPLTDQIKINIISNAVVEAGDDQAVCEGTSTIKLQGKLTGGDGANWSTNGTGLFSSNADLNGVYSFSLEDISKGSVFLILRANNGNSQCKPVIDTLIASVVKKPKLYAGADIDICKTAVAVLNGQLSSGKGEWHSSGTGKFSSVNDLKGTYFPSVADINEGIIKISLTSLVNSSCGKFSDTLLLIIRPRQGPTFTPLPDKNICSGETINLGSIVNTNFQYQWSPGQNLSDSLITNPIVSLVNTSKADSVYSYVLTIKDDTTGCSSFDTVDVTVNRILKSDAGRDTTICGGSPFIIGTKKALDVIYSWSPREHLSNLKESQPIFNTPNSTSIQNYSYILFINSGNENCGSSDTVKITVNPSPLLDAGHDTTICSGSKILLGKIPQIGNTYLWTPEYGLSDSSLANPEFFYINSNSLLVHHKFELTVSNNFGCFSKDSLLIDTYQGHQSFISKNDSTLFCGQPFTANYAISGFANSKYTWNVTGGSILQGQGTSAATIAWDNTFEKSLMVLESTNDGCASNINFPLNRDSLPISIILVTKLLPEDRKNIIYFKFNSPNNLPNSLVLKRTEFVSQLQDVITIENLSVNDSLYEDKSSIDPMKIYEYSLSVNGRCGGEIVSLPQNNLAIQNEFDGSGKSILSWNAYKNWEAGVASYEIYKKQSDGNFVLFGKTDGKTTSIPYDDSEISQQCYRVKALKKNAQIFSWSNEICVSYSELPNAISPNGDKINDVWIIDNLSDYRNNDLTIFNQWHSEVYHKKGYTNDWGGNNLPDGTYYYILKSDNRNIKGYILITR